MVGWHVCGRDSDATTTTTTKMSMIASFSRVGRPPSPAISKVRSLKTLSQELMHVHAHLHHGPEPRADGGGVVVVMSNEVSYSFIIVEAAQSAACSRRRGSSDVIMRMPAPLLIASRRST